MASRPGRGSAMAVINLFCAERAGACVGRCAGQKPCGARHVQGVHSKTSRVYTYALHATPLHIQHKMRSRTRAIRPAHPTHPAQSNGSNGYSCAEQIQSTAHPAQTTPMTRPSGSLRSDMPQTAAFIDALRDVFGAPQINAAIKSGINGAGTFYACENGREIGSMGSAPTLSISGDDLLAHLPPKKEKK